MAIDSTLYAVDLPAGTYAVGDILQLDCISGPANVRSGRGSAILKQISGGMLNTQNNTWFRLHVKNSDWIDEVSNILADIAVATALSPESGLIQSGADNNLTPNSGWSVYLECIAGGTTTAATSAFAIIDIDYPAVSAVTDPSKLVGIPTSISLDVSNVPVNAIGALTSATWSTKNVDYFKAGFEYCLKEIEVYSGGFSKGFVAFSSAAGMGGLTRIVPISNNPANIRAKISYASKLVKGPMDVKTMFFATTAGTATAYMVHDYVKRAA